MQGCDKRWKGDGCTVGIGMEKKDVKGSFIYLMPHVD